MGCENINEENHLHSYYRQQELQVAIKAEL